MIQYKKARPEDLPAVMEIRLETLRDVFGLSPTGDSPFPAGLVEKTRAYYSGADQTTVLALDGETTVGCGTMCYLEVLPTVDHPSGLRGHLMNVYTKPQYRRQGIARRILELLIEEARERGVTEISLDATEEGRTLYERCGFSPSSECMVLNL
ncbi:MAG: GNAT family N-acetyltransferase [Oscillospiraceae bacterium]|jgi:ribosomal protein S18 acetylase RimI-like enzyme|nr:GNAT family N-acetyltransferase [Oscillospiraceae bacterium]